MLLHGMDLPLWAGRLVGLDGVGLLAPPTAHLLPAQPRGGSPATGCRADVRHAEAERGDGQAAGRRPERAPAHAGPALGSRGAGRVEKIQDYSATVIKRERISGKLSEPEYLFIKIRHKPFSVYLKFLAPHR